MKRLSRFSIQPRSAQSKLEPVETDKIYHITFSGLTIVSTPSGFSWANLAFDLK